MKAFIFLVTLLFITFSFSYSQLLIINEISQGESGSEEYVELIVAGTATCTDYGCVDIRGWYIDDNNGYFASGSGTGIAQGCIRFTNDNAWQCIPYGTLILIYNSGDYNSSIIPANDPFDSNGDCVIVLPVTSNLLERNDNTPNSSTSVYPTNGFTTSGLWTTIGMKNGSDSFQTLNPANLSAPVFSVSWGNNSNNTMIYFPDDMGTYCVTFRNLLSDDYTDQINWVWEEAITGQTPGVPNSPENEAWINSMNNFCQPFVPPVADAGLDIEMPCVITNEQLDASGSVGNNLIYAWSGPDIVSGDYTFNPVIGDIGTYIVTITDLVGCTDTDSVMVTLGTTIENVSAGNDQSICNGQSATFTASGGTTYTWDNGLSNGATQTVNPVATTTYSVTITNDLGCSAIADVTITVFPLPNADAGSDQTICYGSSTNLFASGGTGYSWSTSEYTSSIYVNPLVETLYYVTVSNQLGCTSIDSVTVSVNDQVNPQITVDAPLLCEGDTTSLIASGGVTYNWSNGGSTSEIDVAPLVTTTYTVTAADAQGCTGTASVEIAVSDSVLVSINPEAICTGESSTISANGGDSYLWSTGDTTASITVNPVVTTTYYVTVTSSLCSGMGEATVNVYDPPSINLGADQTICEGTNINLSADAGYTYVWSTGEVSQTISVSPLLTTQYSVTANNGFCTGTDEISISVTELPTVFAGIDQIICDGESTVLFAIGGTDYVWSTGDTVASIMVNPTLTTTYYVTVTSNSCSNNDSVTVQVNSYPVPDLTEDTDICFGESIELSVNQADSYIWSTGGVLSNIAVAPLNSTTYYVTVIENGCSVTDSVLISVIPEIQSEIVAAPSVICEDQYTTLTASGGSEYLWSTGDTTTSIIVFPGATGYYYVEVTESVCSETDSILITVEPGITIISNPPEICQGEYTQLTVSQGDTYIWSNSETTQTISVSPLSSQYFYVTVTGAACTDSSSIFVTVHSLPSAYAGVDTTICRGTIVTLEATGGSYYYWSNSEYGSQITVSPDDSTTFYVTVTDIFNCSSSDNISVNILPVPVAYISDDEVICEGESTTITASGGMSYSWTPQAGLNSSTDPQPIATPLSTTTYTVSVYNQYGCYDTQNMTITVTPISEVDIAIQAIPGFEICAGDQTEFTAIVTNAGLNPVYKWKLNNLNVGSNSSVYSTSGLQDGDIIYCQVLSNQYCVTNNPASDQQQVIVHSLPAISFSVDDRNGCEPHTVSFSGNNEDLNHSWIFERQDYYETSNEFDPVIEFSEVGEYDVTLIVEDAYGCINTLPYSALIQVYGTPYAQFYPDPVRTDLFRPTIDFTNSSAGGLLDFWDFGDGSTSIKYSHLNTYHTYTTAGNYSVMLTVESKEGCRDSISLQLIIDDVYTFYAPSAIIPTIPYNGVFRVFGTGIDSEGFELYIYDRWGELVFYSEDIDVGWDGRIKERNYAKNGVYTWLVKFTSDGQVITKSGPVTVIQ